VTTMLTRARGVRSASDYPIHYSDLATFLARGTGQHRGLRHVRMSAQHGLTANETRIAAARRDSNVVHAGLNYDLNEVVD
jgi:hypothetical protein